MRQRSDSLDQRSGHRRIVIVLLSALIVSLFTMPSLAPIIGGLVALTLLWDVIGHYASTPLQGHAPAKREPALWDDGFGAV